MKPFRISLMLASLVTAIWVGFGPTVQAEQRLALKGYDPVAYFTEQRPMLGNSSYQRSSSIALLTSSRNWRLVVRDTPWPMARACNTRSNAVGFGLG
jgi:hypothetical protein